MTRPRPFSVYATLGNTAPAAPPILLILSTHVLRHARDVVLQRRVRRRASRSAALRQRVPEAHRHHRLPLLRVPVHVHRQLAPETLRPLRPVEHQQPPLVGRIARVRHLPIGVRQPHLLRHDHRDALHGPQHAGEHGRVRPQLVHRPELVDRLRPDERVHVHHPHQLRRARPILAELRPHLVEHVVAHGCVVVVRLSRIVHQRQVQDPVVPEQPVPLARRARRYGRAVRVDVVRPRRIRVQDDVVQRLRRVPDQTLPVSRAASR